MEAWPQIIENMAELFQTMFSDKAAGIAHRTSAEGIIKGAAGCPSDVDECEICAVLVCPFGTHEHLFHDGCPDCHKFGESAM